MATLPPDSQLPRLAPGPAERGRRLRPSPSADSGTAWCQGTAGRRRPSGHPGRGSGVAPTAGRSPPPQPTLVERREWLAETLRGTSGSDSLALSMLMWVRQLLSVRWIPLLGGGDSPEEQRRASAASGDRVSHTWGADSPASCGSGLSPPVRPRRGHRPGSVELCPCLPPGRRCWGRCALVCRPSVRSLVVTPVSSAPTAS